jgi:anti-anti-sigma factor
MGSTTESRADGQLAGRDSKASSMPCDQRSFMSEHGLCGFSAVTTAERPGLTRVTVAGEIDIATSPQLGAALSGPGSDTVLVVLDLSQVTFIDSTGLSVILRADDRLREADRRLVLIPGPRPVQRFFEITGTDRRLDFLTAPDVNCHPSPIDPRTR